ncbi:hypothetical protein MKW94_016928, partial [Papaver nudicaule]|nr:hypothetical protein [Papaver nudicaule]
MAAILDPRIKGEFIPENLKSESHMEEVRNYFMKNYTNPQDREDGSYLSFTGEVARRRHRVNMTVYRDEFSQYLSEPPSPATDVFDWWKENTSRYPQLSLMARDFLAVQPTSVSPDEVFSGKGDEIDKQRFCLPYGSTRPVLCLREWIESGFKLKYRLQEVDFE